VSDASAIPWYERAFGATYPHVYAHRNEAEARAALALVERLLAGGPSAPWLDLGCGQGRHLPLLAAPGRKVIGVDLSAELLARAATVATDAALIRADMRQLPLASGRLAAVLSLFTAFGYFGKVAAHGPVVAEIARVLLPGGAWVLDFLDAERVAEELVNRPSERERVSGPLLITEQRRLAEDPRRVVKSVRLRPRPGREAEAAALGLDATGAGEPELAYDEVVTLFTLGELDDLANVAGLVRRDEAGGYDGRPLVPGASERWILVYEKPESRAKAERSSG
jgi:SAM-dependent methyltransferase